jgi:hypothetical protein
LCYSIFSFICMFCWSLFVLLYFFFWPLCCLSFFDIRILITPLLSSNSSFHNMCAFLISILVTLFKMRCYWIWYIWTSKTELYSINSTYISHWIIYIGSLLASISNLLKLDLCYHYHHFKFYLISQAYNYEEVVVAVIAW